MNKIDQIYESHNSPSEFATEYCSYLAELLTKLDHQKIGEMTEWFLAAHKEDRQVFFIGNGGSAATASHFANDFAIGTRNPKKPFKAISLTDNAAVLTCIGNDFGYDQIFTKQLEVLMQPGDLLVAISASGNSPNIISACQFAKSKECKIIGLTGFDGGQLKELSDLNVHIPTQKGEYGPVEDIHMVLDHLISSYVHRQIRAQS